MSQLLHIDTEYKQWIQELSLRYRQSQIKASIRVNSEMLRFYWSVGKDITERQFDNKYGTHFYENLSRDLVAALNVKKGFSPTNLKYTKYFYSLYSPLSENRQQPADELVDGNRQQPADEFELLFCIPWSHHQRIIDKAKGDSVGREFRLNAGGKDKYIDLLFYIIPLHRYCVIEVKTTEFDFQDVGQLAGYTAMVDDLLNTPNDNPSIGLLICKERNAVLARYALSRINAPIGISKYELAQQQLPKDIQSALPSVEEIENELNNKGQL